MCAEHDGERLGSVDEVKALEPSLPLQEGAPAEILNRPLYLRDCNPHPEFKKEGAREREREKVEGGGGK